VKAIVCSQFGGPDVLEVREVEEPVAGEGQAVIDVAACALNFPDLLMIQDLYQFKPQLPYTPGSEIAGIIRSTGPGVSPFAIGDRVVGSATTGGLAQRAVVPAGRLVRVPDGVGLDQAAGLMYAYGTAHHALRDRAQIQPGESLLVLGAAGGVGLAAVELGRLMGARVIAAASTDEKLDLCRKRGADEVVNYSTEDLKQRVRELTGGHGADVVYDPVGGPYSEPAVRSTAWAGRYLVIGFAAGDIPRIPLNLPLLRGCSIVGVFWGAFVGRHPEGLERTVEQLAQWWNSGELESHVFHSYPLEQAADAFRDLAERRVLGKVVVAPSGAGS
jgi:NADPH:quinone reductase